MSNTPEARFARLEERSDAFLRELARLTKEFDRIGGVTGDVIQWGGALGALERDFEAFVRDFKDFRAEYREEMRREKESADAEHRRLREEIDKARDEREKLRAEMQADMRTNLRERQGMSTTLKVALIGASGVILAAIIAALAHSS